MSVEYPKNMIHFNSYTNKKGNKKFSINISDEIALKLSNYDEDVISALVSGIKKEFQ